MPVLLAGATEENEAILLQCSDIWLQFSDDTADEIGTQATGNAYRLTSDS